MHGAMNGAAATAGSGEAGLPPIYTIYDDQGDAYPVTATLLDGERRKVRADVEFNPNGSAKLPDGTRVRIENSMTGLRYRTEHLPTRGRLEGVTREIGDFLMFANFLVVSAKFRSVMEELEPGKHLFEPLDLRWKDGTSPGEWFWFFPVQRLFGYDIEATTHEYDEEFGWFETVNGKQYVGKLTQIGDNHIWVDVAADWHFPKVSDGFRRAMDAAGVRGIGYHAKPTVR